ncbi:MAG: hypothetical protein ACQES0_08295 [Bacteroidota bacterium]
MEQKLSDKEKAYLESLKSDDRARIYKTIDEIHQAGSVKLLPAVFDLYQAYNDDELREKIVMLLRDLKDKQVPEIFMRELKTRQWDSGLALMLSTCWQSALDFSPYLEDFLPYANSDDLTVQMEALTNLEEYFYNKNAEGQAKVRNQLKNLAVEASGPKRDLIMSFLQGMKEL